MIMRGEVIGSTEKDKIEYCNYLLITVNSTLFSFLRKYKEKLIHHIVRSVDKDV